VKAYLYTNIVSFWGHFSSIDIEYYAELGLETKQNTIQHKQWHFIMIVLICFFLYQSENGGFQSVTLVTGKSIMRYVRWEHAVMLISRTSCFIFLLQKKDWKKWIRALLARRRKVGTQALYWNVYWARRIEQKNQSNSTDENVTEAKLQNSTLSLVLMS